jgi:hypothetical protein
MWMMYTDMNYRASSGAARLGGAFDAVDLSPRAFPLLRFVPTFDKGTRRCSVDKPPIPPAERPTGGVALKEDILVRGSTADGGAEGKCVTPIGRC